MPNYFYIAKTKRGEDVTGNLNAKDLRQLAQDLKKDGLLLIKATSDSEKKRSMDLSIPFLGVPQNEKIMMTKNLWVMVSAGLSLVKSFDILANQSKSPKLKKALLEARERINKGEGIHEALAGHPDIFSDLFLNMIKVGEESGTLEEVFQNLSIQMEKEHELKAKIKQAMIYPGMVMATMILIGIIIITVVLPKLKYFFSTMNTDLPIYTKALIWLGDFATDKWYIVIFLPFVLGFGLLYFFRTSFGSWLKDTVGLKIPIISDVIKKNNTALLIRSLSSLISAGVPLVRSLEITSGTVNNIYFKKALLDSAEKVKKGEKLSSALSAFQNIFPFGALEMIEVGEETGKTTTILKKLAEFYEKEAMATTENLSLAIEPMLILVLGVCVAFFAFAVIQPMYSVLGSVQ